MVCTIVEMEGACHVSDGTGGGDNVDWLIKIWLKDPKVEICTDSVFFFALFYSAEGQDSNPVSNIFFFRIILSLSAKVLRWWRRVLKWWRKVNENTINCRWQKELVKNWKRNCPCGDESAIFWWSISTRAERRDNFSQKKWRRFEKMKTKSDRKGPKEGTESETRTDSDGGMSSELMVQVIRLLWGFGLTWPRSLPLRPGFYWYFSPDPLVCCSDV